MELIGRTTSHEEFANCPGCGHSTIGMERPWSLYHVEGCAVAEFVRTLNTSVAYNAGWQAGVAAVRDMHDRDMAARDQELERLRRHLKGAVEALRELEAWAARMPDAGFSSDDPRWGWWHEKPTPYRRKVEGGNT